MSTSDASKLQLKELDKAIDAIEKQLPRFSRLRRRYLNLRVVAAGQVFEYYGVFKGWLAAGGAAKLGSWFGIKFPVIAEILHEGWEYVVTFAEGAAAVVEHTSV